jgi:hypothetical protein
LVNRNKSSATSRNDSDPQFSVTSSGCGIRKPG